MKLFKNPVQLQELIDKYFDSLEPKYMYDKEGEIIYDKSGAPVMSPREPATVASLAYFVGLSSLTQFNELKSKKQYTKIIDRALLRTEAYIERLLFDKSAATGAKYLLEESFGRETVEIKDEDEGGVVILSDILNKTDSSET